MNKILLLVFCLIGIQGFAQQPGFCKDSSIIPDTYYQCAISVAGDEYNPVCGCDLITYRNTCAAIHWGGVLDWEDNTVCGNFHIDFRPTAIDYQPAKFQAFIKNRSNQTIPVGIYIYDTYGKAYFAWYDVTNNNGLFPISPLEIPAQQFPRGIYFLVVTVNGENQTIKFAKVSE